MSRTISTRGLIALAILMPVLAACGAARSRPAPRRRTAAVSEGRRLFVSERCGVCHALDVVHALGGSGPDFDTSERLDRAQLRNSLTEGANGMPSYAGRLVPRQLDALAAFLYVATHSPPARG